MKSVAMPLILLLTLSACASSETTRLEKSNDVGVAAQQPLRDLNLMQNEIPPVLRQAVGAPYALAEPATCESLARDVDALTAVLGPDIDVPPGPNGGGGDAVIADLVRGVVGIPFSGLVRNMTGAAAREREARRAILSGMARRSYLKGVAHDRNCS